MIQSSELQVSKMESVSVVITAYNSEVFIRQAIATVKAQSSRVQEIIVIDDGSNDRTASIAAELGVRVIAVSNGGLSAARNLGIQAATSEWVAFLDVDDLWHPRKIELQLAAIAADPSVGLVFTDHDAVSVADGRIEQRSVINSELSMVRARERRLTDFAFRLNSSTFNESLPSRYVILPSTAMVRRTIAIEVGGFSTKVRTEDADFFMRVTAIAETAYLEIPLVAYMRHPSQISARWKLAEVQLAFHHHVLANSPQFHPLSVTAMRRHYPVLLYNLAATRAKDKNYGSAALLFVSAVLTAIIRGSIDSLLRSIGKSKTLRSIRRRVERNQMSTKVQSELVFTDELCQIEVPWRNTDSRNNSVSGAPL